MCGLVVSYDGISSGIDEMLHRGTEDPIITQFGDTVVAHIRLPIINLEGGAQPYDSTWLVGEIFNYKELNPDAISDTQVFSELLRGGNIHIADGMWAGAIKTGRGVLCFTDYLCQKPLYYSAKYRMVASEPDAFTVFDLTVDEIYISNSIKWGYDPTGRTQWNEVKQLPAGHYIGPNMIPIAYWDWHKVNKPRDLKTAFIKAVKNRLVSDQPICMLLSGGLDSSLTYKVAESLGADLKVFHVENGELDSLKQVCDTYEDLLMDYPSLSAAAQCMHSDAGSLLPQYALGAAVKAKGYHVTLSGDGADELFGGYSRAKEYDSQHSDVFVELPYWHNPRLDRVMMRHTIENRTPFMAPEIVKYALSLPWEQRTDKQALKAFAEDYLPDAVVNQPKKALKSSDWGLEHRIKLSNSWRTIYDKRYF